MNKLFYKILFVGIICSSCSSTPDNRKADNGAFAKPQNTNSVHINRIIDSGELIIATISSPDNYFDYQGIPMGIQYALSENFAASLGVAVRVELANDTTELLQKLKKGDADLIAMQLPEETYRKAGLLPAGASHAKFHTSWGVKADAEDLATALNDWYAEGVEIVVKKKEKQRIRQRHSVRRKVQSPFISREKGIISIYDSHFKEASRTTGWDWKLIAAQCYQESGFDPNAVSWAGAKGLMQIMPGTASHLRLPESKIFLPAHNIHAAARYICELQTYYKHISDPEEKIKFVLASYNGGTGHIQDAQALTRKYGGNPNKWEDVSYYVEALGQRRFYCDPVVRHGYMIGSETYNYVSSIITRWKQYGGRVTCMSPASTPANNRLTPNNITKHRKSNRFNKELHILTEEELGTKR